MFFVQGCMIELLIYCTLMTTICHSTVVTPYWVNFATWQAPIELIFTGFFRVKFWIHHSLFLCAYVVQTKMMNPDSRFPIPDSRFPIVISDFITENHFSEKQLCGHTSIDLELVFAT
jgi:hypothetical protein